MSIEAVKWWETGLEGTRLKKLKSWRKARPPESDGRMLELVQRDQVRNAEKMLK
jgi:hypothetical protein